MRPIWAILLLLPALEHAQAQTTNTSRSLQDFTTGICPTNFASTNPQQILQTSDPGQRNNEISGLAFSSQYFAPSGAPILYGINDGGNGERLVIWDSGTGQRLRTLVVPGVTNTDWEDLTIGTCGSTSGQCLYIGDIGDNQARGSSGRNSRRNANSGYQLIKLVEPNWEGYQDYSVLPSTSIQVLKIQYNHPSSPTRFADSEALFLDPTGWGADPLTGADYQAGDLYIATKWDGTSSKRQYTRLFYIPVSAWQTPGGVYAPATVGKYDAPMADFRDHTWTRGEMSLDGTVIALGSTFDTRLYLRCPGQSVADALTLPTIASTSTTSVPGTSGSSTTTSTGRQSCYGWPITTDRMPESLAWTPDGARILEVTEGVGPIMKWTNLNYNAATNTADNSNPSVVVSRTNRLMMCQSPQSPEIELMPGNILSAEEPIQAETTAPTQLEAIDSYVPITYIPTVAPVTKPPTITPTVVEQPTAAPGLELVLMWSDNGQQVCRDAISGAVFPRYRCRNDEDDRVAIANATMFDYYSNDEVVSISPDDVEPSTGSITLQDSNASPISPAEGEADTPTLTPTLAPTFVPVAAVPATPPTIMTAAELVDAAVNADPSGTKGDSTAEPTLETDSADMSEAQIPLAVSGTISISHGDATDANSNGVPPPDDRGQRQLLRRSLRN